MIFSWGGRYCQSKVTFKEGAGEQISCLSFYHPALSFPPVCCWAFSWPNQTEGQKAWGSMMFSIWVLLMEQKGSTEFWRIKWDEQTKVIENARKLPCFPLSVRACVYLFKTVCDVSFNLVSPCSGKENPKLKDCIVCFRECELSRDGFQDCSPHVIVHSGQCERPEFSQDLLGTPPVLHRKPTYLPYRGLSEVIQREPGREKCKCKILPTFSELLMGSRKARK